MTFINTKTNIDTFIRWLIPILYFLIPIAFYLRTYDSCQIKITVFQIGVTTLLGLWLVRLLEKDSRFFSDKLIVILPLILYLISGCISFLISQFPIKSYPEFTRRVLYIGLALMIIHLFDEEKYVKRLLYFFIAAGWISCLYGLVQFIDTRFFPPPPQHGIDPFIWRHAFGNSLFSTHGNPGFFADFLVVLSPVVLGMILKTRSIWLILLFILSIFNLPMAIDKEGWAGFFFGICAFILLWITFFSKLNKNTSRKIVTGGIIVIVLICMTTMMYLIKHRTDGIKFRAYTWLSTYEMILKRPVFGSGIGTFWIAYPKYRRPQIFFIEGRHNTETDHPENEYFEVWYDEGLVGLGIFLWLITTFIVIGLRALRRYTSATGVNSDLSATTELDNRVYYLLGILSSFIGLLIENLISVPTRFISIGIFFWYFIALIAVLSLPSIRSDLDDITVKIRDKISKLMLKRVLQILIIICIIFLNIIFCRFFIADMEHNIAIYFAKRSDWVLALIHFNNATHYHKDFVMPHYFMGNILNDRFIMYKTFHSLFDDDKITRDDSERAIAKYDDVKRFAPNYVQVHYQTGLIYLKLGEYYAQKERYDIAKSWENYFKAIENFEKYREIDPVFDQTYLRIAYVYIKLGDFKKAEETYLAHIDSPNICRRGGNNILWEDWSIRRLHEYSETAVNLGNAYYVQNKFSEAEQFYRQAIKYNPRNINAWKNLLVLMLHSNRTIEIITIAKEMLKIDPNNVDAKRVLNNLGNN